MQTLLLGTLCVSLSLYCLCYSVQEYKNRISYKKYILKKQTLHDYKEFLFTCLSNEVKAGSGMTSNSKLKDLLTSNSIMIKTPDNKAYIHYEKIKNCLVIVSYSDEFFHREDYYDYNVVNNRINYKFRSTSYVEGVVK